ncbi:aldolase catalytic domain-containing protein [Enterococcus cecorum]|nr:aldolase catalytic domain-containing protein [Enterococcus cecorum]
MSVQITDCTIRDGGYLFNKNSNPEFIKGIMKGLADAGIDFVETGFLQTNCTGETLVYANSVDAKRYLPMDKNKTEFIGFCDNSRYSVDNLDEYTGESFKWLRISFAKHEADSALKFCFSAIQKGYLVQFNPMDTLSYSDDELLELISKVNEIQPASFSIVDTFGAMDMRELVHFFNQIDGSLDKSIKIGLHSHDNLGLSCALAERMIDLAEERNRDIIVDGSLFGMGRGAGNARTEILASYINKYCGGNYDIEKLIITIEKYITPILNEVSWGYDIPMFICGIMHSHVDNVYHLTEKYDCDAYELFETLSGLSLEQRIRYGKNYSKTDFSEIDALYTKLKKFRD